MSEEPASRTYADSSDPELRRAYAWYGDYYGPKTHERCHRWFVEYVRSHHGGFPDAEAVARRVPHGSLSTSIVAGVRLCMRCDLPSDVIARLRKNVDAILLKYAGAETRSVSRNVRESASDLIGEVEGMIDDAVWTGAEFPSVYDLLVRRSTGGPQARLLLAKFKPQLAEMLGLRYIDSEYRDSYMRIGRDRISTLVDALQTIVDDCSRYLGNKSASRSPRKKRAASAEKLARGLRFKREHPELRLVSVEPVTAMGASEAWLYDIKTRRLSRYVARTRAGLKGKGVSITDFDPERSVSKVLRKPEETLQRVVTGGKRVLDSLMNDLTTKGSVPSGRTSVDTVFLKTVRWPSA